MWSGGPGHRVQKKFLMMLLSTTHNPKKFPLPDESPKSQYFFNRTSTRSTGTGAHEVLLWAAATSRRSTQVGAAIYQEGFLLVSCMRAYFLLSHCEVGDRNVFPSLKIAQPIRKFSAWPISHGKWTGPTYLSRLCLGRSQPSGLPARRFLP